MKLKKLVKVDREASLLWRARIGAQPKDCYRNSAKTLANLPAGSTYVEGLAVASRLNIPLGHGFCVLPDGETVVDVTWVDDEVVYLPVLSLTLSQLMDRFVANQGNVILLPLVTLEDDPYAYSQMVRFLLEH